MPILCNLRLTIMTSEPEGAFVHRELVKIFHYARFDLAAIAQYFGVHGPRLCTKIASKLVRTYTDRHGLKICAANCWMLIFKSPAKPDWGHLNCRMPSLTMPPQMFCICTLKDRLETMLDREGRRPMAEACFDFVLVRSAMDLAGFEDLDIFLTDCNRAWAQADWKRI